VAPRTKSDIQDSIKKAIRDASPQVRTDVNKGPFFSLAVSGVSGPLADASTDVERMAQLSTLQFPVAATTTEVLATARAFGVSVGSGGFASGVAYVFTASGRETRSPLP
jgi:hypothetical protein